MFSELHLLLNFYFGMQCYVIHITAVTTYIILQNPNIMIKQFLRYNANNKKREI